MNKYSLTTATDELRERLLLHTHTFGINDITNLQNELNKYSLTAHTHTDLAPRMHSHLEYEFKVHQHLEYVLEMENIQEEIIL